MRLDDLDEHLVAVAERDRLVADLVERLPGDAGAKLDLEPLLLAGDEALFGDKLGKVTVAAEVVEHLRGPKLRVNKFKPKRGYRRKMGHRQELTRIRVTKITSGS